MTHDASSIEKCNLLHNSVLVTFVVDKEPCPHLIIFNFLIRWMLTERFQSLVMLQTNRNWSWWENFKEIQRDCNLSSLAAKPHFFATHYRPQHVGEQDKLNGQFYFAESQTWYKDRQSDRRTARPFFDTVYLRQPRYTRQNTITVQILVSCIFRTTDTQK